MNYPTSAVSSGGLYQWLDGRENPDTFTTILEYGKSGEKGKGFQVMFQSHQTNCAPGRKPNNESGQDAATKYTVTQLEEDEDDLYTIPQKNANVLVYVTYKDGESRADELL